MLHKIAPALFLLLALFLRRATADSADPLHAAFIDPPRSSWPAVWWLWGETPITHEGITHDLESMGRIGIGGVCIYEQVFTLRPEALHTFSPQWHDAIKFAAAECHRLGIRLEINTGSGYVAGGPWITPDLGMQRLVSSQLVLDGNKDFQGPLPEPPTYLHTYHDVAILAYPTPEGGSAEATKWDHNTITFAQPFTARSITYQSPPGTKALVIGTQVPNQWRDDGYGQGVKLMPLLGTLEAGDDGITYHKVCDLPPVYRQHDSWKQQTVAFPAATAKHFRLNVTGTISAVKLSGEARIDQWEKKSGEVVDLTQVDRTPQYGAGEILSSARIIDLTSQFKADGTLTWKVPAGRWTVLRLGYTPTGGATKHGRPEAMGLECDKLSAAAARVQFDHYVGVVLADVRSVPDAVLAGVDMDSAEHGSQNWTATFLEEFRQRRGYDLLPFLPVMQGRIVDSREKSDRILYDVRRTISDLMADNYYGTFQKLCHDNNLTFMAEAPGIATCLPSDVIACKGRTDVPQGEFWMSQVDGNYDCKEAASAAHVYGKTIAAGEAFTGSRPDAYPAMMRPFADAAVAMGINRFVVCASLMQPWDQRKPGVTEDRFFLPFQRHMTWWNDSRDFWTGLARSSFLCRQGSSVADICYDLGGDEPVKIVTARLRPVPPAGYDFDVCDEEVLLARMGVDDQGRVVVPGGASYRVLVVSPQRTMTLATAKKLQELITAGATVLSARPQDDPSAADGADGPQRLKEIADQIWGPATTASGRRQLGKGKIVWGMELADLLKADGVAPDFTSAPAQDPSPLIYCHRHTADTDLYFVANHTGEWQDADCSFRVTGKVPELWDPDDGTTTLPALWHQEAGRTIVPVHLAPWQAKFFIFRQPAATVDPLASVQLGDRAIDPTMISRGSQDELVLHAATPGDYHIRWQSGKTTTLTVAPLPQPLDLSTLWSVHFDPQWGGPETAAFDTLVSWIRRPEEGIRNYSGAAVYQRDFDLPASAVAPTRRWLLDLGDVKILARVRVNDQDMGTAWKTPFQLDITRGLKPGTNHLALTVINVWANRLIADSALPADKQISWATYNPYTKDSPRVDSGLLGPVRLSAQEEFTMPR